MSLKRFATRRDSVEPSIIKALRRVGADCILLDTWDVLILFRGQLFMLDCKSHRGRITASQQDLIDRGWPLKFAKTPEDALKVIGAVK